MKNLIKYINELLNKRSNHNPINGSTTASDENGKIADTKSLIYVLFVCITLFSLAIIYSDGILQLLNVKDNSTRIVLLQSLGTIVAAAALFLTGRKVIHKFK